MLNITAHEKPCYLVVNVGKIIAVIILEEIIGTFGIPPANVFAALLNNVLEVFGKRINAFRFIDVADIFKQAFGIAYFFDKVAVIIEKVSRNARTVKQAI